MAEALDNSVTVSNKGMSHDFRICVSLFLKGNGNDKASGTVLFFFPAAAFFLWVNMEGSEFCKSGYFAYFLILWLDNSPHSSAQ